jgi:RNA polymerase sigma factor (TIGR02999 family)
MNEITRILNSAQSEPGPVMEQLLPVIYEELRQLARHKMAGEAPNHTLQPTALVHEAWLRLVAPGQQNWQNRAHFFAAAAEAMRRILVDHARRKKSQKRGSGITPEELQESLIVLSGTPEEVLAVHEAPEKLEAEDHTAAELVKLKYFVGMTMEEAALALNLPLRSTERLWTYARVWLRREIRSAAKT